MKTRIEQVMILDGSGAAPFHGNVLIDGENIAAVTRDPQETLAADTVIDGHGLCLAPGFIDTHSHSDLEALVHPELLPKIRQGITTEFLGQDGISMAPLPKKYIAPWRKNLAGLDGDSEALDWGYGGTSGYLARLAAAHPATNTAYLVPHGNIRMEAMGLDNRPPTPDEMKTMKAIVAREMEAGAYGMSTGLIYIPCTYAATEELIELCRVVASYGGRFVVHQRSEADTVIASMKEILRIGRESGVHVHFSHFKVCGKANARFIPDMLRLLHEGQEEGIDISFDQYPYAAGSTMLGVLLPPWAHDGGTEKLMERLQDPALRAKMAHDIAHGIPGWDNFMDFAGPDRIVVTSVQTAANQDTVGKSLSELAELRGKNVCDALFDLLFEEKNAVGMVDFYGDEAQVEQFLQEPCMNACTDGLLGGKPHPRVYGAFPRILRKYVREKPVITLAEAIHKMTGQAAENLGLKGRGLLRPGFSSDLVLFDPATVSDKGTFVDPCQFSDGIRMVIVNGQVAWKEGEKTLRGRYGRVLKK